MGEQHQANGEHHEHDAQTDAQMHGVHAARAEKSAPEAFDDGCQRVELHHPSVFRRHLRQGQDHRRGKHQQLHAEGDEVGEVAVARRQRRDDDAASEAIAREHEQEQRRAKKPAGEMHIVPGTVIDGEKHQKNPELDGKGNEVGDGDGNRDGEPVKIDLAQQGRVAHEGAGSLVYVVGKITPADIARQIEEERRHAVG